MEKTLKYAVYDYYSGMFSSNDREDLEAVFGTWEEAEAYRKKEQEREDNFRANYGRTGSSYYKIVKIAV